MNKVMAFIDFENFDISKYTYYKDMHPKSFDANKIPKIDFVKMASYLTAQLSSQHQLMKTFLFAPKPDDFLMKDPRRKKEYEWLIGHRNKDFFTLIEGRHSARPTHGYQYKDMDINNPKTYYVNEKGTDVNVSAHMITKAFHNAYDTAIVVSGDTDYLPVYDILNTLGITIVIAGVKGQNLMQFKERTDKQIIMDNNVFKKCV